jgi:hypothetical protein
LVSRGWFLTLTKTMTNKSEKKALPEPSVSALEAAPTQTADWVKREFAQARLPDERLRRRLEKIVSAFAQKPTASIPQACANWGEAKGAYRFLENERVVAGELRQGHHLATLDRVKEHRVVLALQDTTTLNYSSHPRTQGLGLLGSHSPKTIGLWLHSTVAVTPKGEPLGWLHNTIWVRPPRRRAVGRPRKKRGRKESFKWVESLQVCQELALQCPQTLLVNVTDREGDFYELFQEALKSCGGGQVHLLVRAHQDRRLAKGQGHLWPEVGTQPVAASLALRVGRKGDQPSRMTRLNIRFCPVTLQAPWGKAGQPITLWAVEASESVPAPKGSGPILWRLLTSLPVVEAAQAIEKVQWYAQRWQIEVLHKVLKSGCQIEQRQLETAQRLERVLSLDLVVAWRVLCLCKRAREMPDDPVSHWLPQAQWQALCCYAQRQTTPPQSAPSVRQAVRWLAQMGGFLGRKRDGEPGPQTLWRGLHKLEAITDMWQLFQQKERTQKCG